MVFEKKSCDILFFFKSFVKVLSVQLTVEEKYTNW